MGGSGRVVLAVEDDPPTLRAMKVGLERAGFTVRTAFDCKTAMQLLDAPAPDLVCVDLCLPDRSGYELCEHLRRTPACAAAPILVMGDAAFPEHMAHAEEAGANAFLKKPFEVESLVRWVEALLEGAPESFASGHTLRAP